MANYYLKYVVIFLLFDCIYGFAQKVEWAYQVTDIRNIDYEFDGNTIENAMGPPVYIDPSLLRQRNYDLYADGYIILPIKNKKFTFDAKFAKPIIGNRLFIGGVFNTGVIRKVFLILKNNKTKPIEFKLDSPIESKFLDLHLEFATETVYGVRIVLDHSKADNWNLIKGIGVYKSKDKLDFKPNTINIGNETIKKEALGSHINTKNCAEFLPRVSLDGKNFYFTRDCGDKKQEQIWACTGDRDSWNTAQELGKPLNNNGHNYVLSNPFINDKLYLANIYGDNGEEIGPGLSYTTFNNKENNWSLPQKVELPFEIYKNGYENYFVSADEQLIIVAMDRPDGYGGLDLYYCTYNKYKKAYDPPINMGNEINTKFDEDFPYLSIDNNTLFYSSKGHIGYGGYDVYVSKRLNNSFNSWSEPLNLGSKLNSKSDDFGFVCSPNGEVAYIASVTIRGEEHNVDIYKFNLPSVIKQPALTTLRGKVQNDINGLALSAKVTIKDLSTKNSTLVELTTDDKGYFETILFHGKEYDIKIESPRFFIFNQKFKPDTDADRDLIMKNYRLKPYLDSGEVAIIRNIQFKFSSTIFTDESMPALEELYNTLKEQKNMIVEIAGHTDDVGSDTFNLKLSRWRAAAVVDYLVNKGIRPWRLKVAGYGEEKPIASNDSEEGRALNRRVEMTIIQDDFTRKYTKKTSPNKKVR